MNIFDVGDLSGAEVVRIRVDGERGDGFADHARQVLLRGGRNLRRQRHNSAGTLRSNDTCVED